MTYQQHLIRSVELVGLLLDYLPLCEGQEQMDGIMEEVGRIRRDVTGIEEMTRTERQMDMRRREMTVESAMNQWRE